MRKMFYVAFKVDPADQGSMATHIQVIVPEGLSKAEEIRYITDRIASEVFNYAASECLIALSLNDVRPSWVRLPPR